MPRIVPSQVVDVIDSIFPEVALGHRQKFEEGHASQLAVIVTLVKQIPTELLVLDPQDYAAFLTAVTTIQNTLTKWQMGAGVGHLRGVPGFGPDPVALIRGALTLCPDEAPAVGTAALDFFDDQELRHALRIDISSMHRALANGEWKAATVLAGSVCEALLLWQLDKKDRVVLNDVCNLLVRDKILDHRPDQSLERWTLHEYIEVAAKLQVISDQTAIQVRLAKNFRNLIHPGRQIRVGQACNLATALSAVAAARHIVEDLKPKDR